MNTYRIKKLIDGFELGKEFGGSKYIAIPNSKRYSVVTVYHGGDSMNVFLTDEPVFIKKNLPACGKKTIFTVPVVVS